MREQNKKAGQKSANPQPAKVQKDFEDNKEPVENQVQSWILKLLIRINDSDALALLPGSTVKIYLALLRHRIKDRPGFALGAKRAMEEAGIKQDHTFYNALNQLEAVGLMNPRKRGPKSFHYINIYDIPLDPNINIMNLKAELNRQKKQRTITSKKGVSVNEKSQENKKTRKSLPHIAEQKNSATITSKKGVSVNEKSQENTKTRKSLPHIAEQKNSATITSKKGVSVSEKVSKMTPTSKNDVATLTSKNDVATLTSKNDTSLHVKKVKKVNIKDEARKILIERENQKSKNQKLDTSEKAFAKQIASFTKKEKADKKEAKKKSISN